MAEEKRPPKLLLKSRGGSWGGELYWLATTLIQQKNENKHVKMKQRTLTRSKV